MDLQKLIDDQNDVSLYLTSHVSSTEAPSKNLVFSPLSLHVVLSLIASGSSGPTRDQILTFLKSKSSDDLNHLSSEIVSYVFVDGSSTGGPKLSYANGLWVEQTLALKSTFKDVVDNYYKSASNQVDFINNADQVTSEVNAWAENQTNGLIKQLLSPMFVDSSTRLIFANALYFKGAWSKKFDASRTVENDFHLLNGKSVKVPYMTSSKKQFVEAFDGFKVLRLPYKQGEYNKNQFSMYILLPDLYDGLTSLMEKASAKPGFLNQHIPIKKVELDAFMIPKFKISFGFEASTILKGLGVRMPFTTGGLTEMIDSAEGQDLYVSSIVQKSFIEVNEEGTEAAAATAAVTRYMCDFDEDLDFIADHPFMFIIREDITGAVLFTGHIMNPLEN